ncbi:hypothetical protein HY416_00235 [Candidatus Kaiserbacteria bacterium]|nr:hypothetical protein [Candidatus Kaiserbacteria bacterium]
MNHLEKVKELELPYDQFVLVGGSILDIHGIRKSDDMDVVVSSQAFQTLKGRGWPVDPVFKEKWGRERLVQDVFEIYTDLYFQKIDYYLPFEVLKEMSKQMKGVYIQSLGALLLIKFDIGREKDMIDIKLIEEYLLGQRRAGMQN